MSVQNFTNVVVSDSLVADSITCDSIVTNTYTTNTDLNIAGTLGVSSIIPTTQNNITMNAGYLTNSSILMLAKDVIIGNQGTNTNLTVYGNISYVESNQLRVKDPLITLNQGGSNVTSIGSGFEVVGSGNVLLGSLKSYSDNGNTISGFESSGNLKCNVLNSNSSNANVLTCGNANINILIGNVISSNICYSNDLQTPILSCNNINNLGNVNSNRFVGNVGNIVTVNSTIVNSGSVIVNTGNIGNINSSIIRNSGNIYMNHTRKLSLYDEADNFNQYAGFNYNNIDNRIAYNTPNISSSHNFFIGTSNISKNEIFKINNDGGNITNLVVQQNANILNLDVTGNITSNGIALNNIICNIVTANIGNITTINSTTLNNSGTLLSGIGNITTINNTTINNVNMVSSGNISCSRIVATTGNLTTINNTNINSSGNISCNRIVATTGNLTNINSTSIITDNFQSGTANLGYDALNYKIQFFSSSVGNNSRINFYNNSNITGEIVNSRIISTEGSSSISNRGNILWELGNLQIGNNLDTKNINLTGISIRLSGESIKLWGNIDNQTIGNIKTNILESSSISTTTIGCSTLNAGIVNGSSANITGSTVLNTLSLTGNITSNLNCSGSISSVSLNTSGNASIGNISTSILTTNNNININDGIIKFNSVSTKKISLFEVGNNDFQYYGFNIASNQLGYNVAGIGNAHRFYCGTSVSSKKELMSIGNLGVEITDDLTVAGMIYGNITSTTLNNSGTLLSDIGNITTLNNTTLNNVNINSSGNISSSRVVATTGNLSTINSTSIINNSNIDSGNVITTGRVTVGSTLFTDNINDNGGGNIVVVTPLKIGNNDGNYSSCIALNKTSQNIDCSTLRSSTYIFSSHFERTTNANYTFITINHLTGTGVNFGGALFLDFIVTVYNTLGNSSTRAYQSQIVFTKESAGTALLAINNGTASATTSGSGMTIGGPNFTPSTATSGVISVIMSAPTVSVGTFSRFTVSYNARMVVSGGNTDSYISNSITNVVYD
jgi:hypothetical protein